MSHKKSLKQEAAQEGAPIWIISFADMMSLLMAFMVAMLAMSTLKKDENFEKAVQSLQQAFGPVGGISMANNPNALMQYLMARKAQLNEGKSSDQGIEGEHPSVKSIREGESYTLGGTIAFETGRARLLEGEKAKMDSFVSTIKGYNYKVRVRGHAAAKLPEQYSDFQSLDDLSYARACAVKNYLVEKGIRSERITLEACGANEPLFTQAYDEKSIAANRRVEIIITESLVEDFKGKPNEDTGDTIR